MHNLVPGHIGLLKYINLPSWSVKNNSRKESIANRKNKQQGHGLDGIFVS